MKKTLHPFFLLIFIFAACSKSNDAEPKNSVKKNPAQVVGTLTLYQSGQPSAVKIPWSKQEFDLQNQLTLSYSRAGEDDLDIHKSHLDTITFKYVGSKLIEKQDKDYLCTYAYHGVDTVELKKYDSQGFYSVETREYGSNGKVNKSTTYIRLFSEPYTKVYGYDAKNNNVKIDYFAPYLPSYQFVFTYDERGNVLTQGFFDSSNAFVVQWRYGYKYDDQNRLSEYTRTTLFPVEYRKLKNYYGKDGALIKQDVFQSNSFDGPFGQIGTVDFEYTYY